MELLSFVVVEKLFVLLFVLVLAFVLLLLLMEVRDEVEDEVEEEAEEEVVNVRILDDVCILCILYCVKISYLS